jgi:alpha-galactosidase
MIPTTGEGPLIFSANKLPDGLKLDEKTGIITGSIKQAGKYVVEIKVTGPKGTATRKLTIVGGDHKLALTPPLGWNSWNVWAGAIDDGKVRQAADWMVKSGLAAHGFQYINIDDCWQADRDANGEIRPNEKFPDMKALSDYIHSKGLKFGIYSSPGPKTCAGFEGSYEHEDQDAKTYAKWGVDYLKHDLCSYYNIAKDQSPEEMKKPYIVMRDALAKCGRDIIYSLCQYGLGEVWKWGAEVEGNCWRTTYDIFDGWSSGDDDPRYMDTIGFGQAGLSKYAGPGHWNDPDMLVVGKVGWGTNIHPSNLRPNEQVTHITLWCIISAPLLIGCDMTQMDQFTLDLLTNDELLDINQDPLGKPADRVSKDGDVEVWARPLWDGTMAVALFNRSIEERPVTAKWSDLGITGSQPVRDLWLHKDLGEMKDSYTEAVPAHGAVIVKIGKPKEVD